MAATRAGRGMGLLIGVGQSSPYCGTSVWGGRGAVGSGLARSEGQPRVCYGPSGIAWPVLGGLAGRPFCELLGLGLTLPGADETDPAGDAKPWP
jgi:hypothetical protein